MRERLGDEHSVERVAEGAGKGTGLGGVRYRDGQLFKAFVGYGAKDVRYYRPSYRQFAKPVFGGNLPRGRGADKDDVVIVCYRSLNDLGQPDVI